MLNLGKIDSFNRRFILFILYANMFAEEFTIHEKTFCQLRV